VAVEEEDHSYAHCETHQGSLGEEFVEELEESFVNYHELMEPTTIKVVTFFWSVVRIAATRAWPSL
jgi:urate oxidase